MGAQPYPWHFCSLFGLVFTFFSPRLLLLFACIFEVVCYWAAPPHRDPLLSHHAKYWICFVFTASAAPATKTSNTSTTTDTWNTQQHWPKVLLNTFGRYSKRYGEFQSSNRHFWLDKIDTKSKFTTEQHGKKQGLQMLTQTTITVHNTITIVFLNILQGASLTEEWEKKYRHFWKQTNDLAPLT